MKKFLLATVLLLVAIAPALAIDFKTEIKGIDGAAIPIDPANKSQGNLTLGKVCEDALVATLPGDSPSPSEKNTRFWIAMKIHEGKEQLTVDEIVTVKKVIGMAYGPLVIGRSYQLLDPVSTPKQ